MNSLQLAYTITTQNKRMEEIVYYVKPVLSLCGFKAMEYFAGNKLIFRNH